MKVQDLIENLDTLDPDISVQIFDSVLGRWAEVTYMTILPGRAARLYSDADGGWRYHYG